MNHFASNTPRSPKTLVERLGPVVSSIRGRVHGAVGTHAYRVFLVTSSWSGDAPSRGSKTEKRVELFCGRDRNGRLVPPSVNDARGSQLRYKFHPEGLVEDGNLIVDEISDVGLVELGLVNFGRLESFEGSWFEVVHDSRDGAEPPVRRMQLDGCPQHDVQGCQWRLMLRPLAGISNPLGGAL